MRTVSNTSPVSNLAILGDLDLLRRKYGSVVIPEAVRRELARLSHPEGRTLTEKALNDGWLVVETVPDRRLLPVLRRRIDEGEAEAIELARQTDADLLLIDDLDGRAVANEESLPYTGLLGVLAEEKLAGNIMSLKAQIARLRAECGFFVSTKVEAKVLLRVGEL
jgi:predicted nucleic acid-binding protein